jgi:hypothetical protein
LLVELRNIKYDDFGKEFVNKEETNIKMNPQNITMIQEENIRLKK